MIDRTLRARIILEEARALGLDLADLIAAHATSTPLPTVSAYIDAIAPTFNPATAATYRPYWRLTAARIGDWRLAEVTLVDLAAVVDAASTRAMRNRPGSTGRASRETCVAALRAPFRRALDTGLITVNPAAALLKPRRVRSRQRALDDRELEQLVDAVRTTSRDPDLDLLVIRFHLESGARREGALSLRCRDLDPTCRPFGCARRATANASSPSHHRWSSSSTATPHAEVLTGSTTQCCAPPTVVPFRRVATTPSSSVPAPACPGHVMVQLP